MTKRELYEAAYFLNVKDVDEVVVKMMELDAISKVKMSLLVVSQWTTKGPRANKELLDKWRPVYESYAKSFADRSGDFIPAILYGDLVKIKNKILYFKIPHHQLSRVRNQNFNALKTAIGEVYGNWKLKFI